MGCKIKIMIEKIFVFKKINKVVRKRYMILKSEREREISTLVIAHWIIYINVSCIGNNNNN